MGRYQPKNISLEGSAAFSDELSSSNLKAQERYQKGYSGDDPLKIQDSKRDDQADEAVVAGIGEFNTLMDNAQSSMEDENPFDCDPIPKVIETGDQDHDGIDGAIESLEEIMTALDDTEVFTVSDSVNVKPNVDIELDTNEKIVVDEKIQAAIAKNPETCASLESIILCNEVNVHQIRQSVKYLIDELKNKTST